VSTSTEEAPVVAEPVVKETEEVSQSDRDKAMGQAYSAAQRDLRVAHQDEFNRYYQKQCADRGIEWTPRKSKAEQALDERMLNVLLRLLAEIHTATLTADQLRIASYARIDGPALAAEDTRLRRRLQGIPEVAPSAE